MNYTNNVTSEDRSGGRIELEDEHKETQTVNDTKSNGVESRKNPKHSLSKRGSILLHKAFVRSKSKDSASNSSNDVSNSTSAAKSSNRGSTSSQTKYQSKAEPVEGGRKRRDSKKRRKPIGRKNEINPVSNHSSRQQHKVEPDYYEESKVAKDSDEGEEKSLPPKPSSIPYKGKLLKVRDGRKDNSDTEYNELSAAEGNEGDEEGVKRSSHVGSSITSSKNLSVRSLENEDKLDKELPEHDLHIESEPYKAHDGEVEDVEEPQKRNEVIDEIEDKEEESDTGGIVHPYSGPIKNPSNENSPIKLKQEKELPLINASIAKAPPSPRKQSILRHKNGNGNKNDSIITDLKGNLRTMDLNAAENALLEPSTQISPSLNLDDKVSLFQYHSSKVLIYDEQPQNPDAVNVEDSKKVSGRLLGHGLFEIFQLHNGDVTYLSCGTSFIYPLLPKLKILRTTFNTFVLPLVNPERYWKISIGTEDDDEVLSKLERILKENVCYRNLYQKEESKKDTNPSEKQTSDVDDAAGGSVLTPISKGAPTSRIVHPRRIDSFSKHYKNGLGAGDVGGTPLKNSDEDQVVNGGFLSHEIPDSPPSAPLSPARPDDVDLTGFDINDTPSKSARKDGTWLIERQTSGNSFSTDVACLDMNSVSVSVPLAAPVVNSGTSYSSRRIELPVQAQSYNSTNILQPKPLKSVNSFHTIQQSNTNNDFAPENDHGNDSDSSMDSLIEEYEENLSSIPHLKSQATSRPPSRAPSRVSTSYGNNDNSIHYRRPALFQGKIDRDETNDDADEEFPSTSLSEYNRIHNGTGRSRRSSRSEVVDWVNSKSGSHTISAGATGVVGNNGLTKSRSTYSIASSYRQGPNGGQGNLSNTYKEIYRSITQRNLAQKLNMDDDAKSSKSAYPHSSRSKYPPLSRSAFTPVSLGSSRPVNSGTRKYTNSVVSERPASVVGGGLTSSEVYKMLSVSKSHNNLKEELKRPAKREAAASSSGGLASKLFGW
ncbi:putative inheritance of peroxisomes protein 1 [[Candida] railenensis]|uniref:Inheritance of peroxisomes protein 1 n=1 Tax=[Candida] railenensis TaxID=45579 RepID=A0A9P0QSB4_9ASCO|nr:putative inheritance of peroxisomes protein 1 [[Candida] railenensis]